MNQSTLPITPEGRLAENILYFSRVLRDAGMRPGPASVVDAVNAVMTAGISTRDDFYWTLHCVLVSRREDQPVFDEAFRAFWRSRELVEKMLQMFSPKASPGEKPEAPKAAQLRISNALHGEQNQAQNPARPEIEVDARFTNSAREVLQARDFAQMNADEIAEARKLMTKLHLPQNEVRTRRYRPVNRIAKADPKRMFAKSMRTGGDLVLPQFRRQKTVHPPIVVLADVSGSMSQYSRILLHFFHALTETRRRVHTFLFGTRLTNVTRQLRMKDPDEALQQCSHAVADWSGGTRIGQTLREFNRVWSRRVLSQGAIVLLITDGLERHEDEMLADEMARLHRSCRRLIWLNPLLRFEGFEAAALGIRTMLPHVDEFRPVHSLDALQGLCEALDGKGGPQTNPRRWLSGHGAGR